MSNTPFLPSTLTLVGQVQNPAVVQNSDGSLSTLEMGRGGDVLASDVRGKYGSMAHRGGVYWAASTTAGIAVPVNTEVSGATNTFGLNNPAGSGTANTGGGGGSCGGPACSPGNGGSGIIIVSYPN